MNAQFQDQAEGKSLKADALALLEDHREIYIRRGRRALLGALLCSGTATADAVRDAVELPPGINPKLFGAVPGLLAKLGIIEQVGFAKTWRPTAHARPLTLWELVDRVTAMRWLASNPDRPDPSDDDHDALCVTGGQSNDG